jgi:hypothetical protein
MILFSYALLYFRPNLLFYRTHHLKLVYTASQIPKVFSYGSKGRAGRWTVVDRETTFVGTQGFEISVENRNGYGVESPPIPQSSTARPTSN